MHIHVTRFMWQNGLLCACYVDQKWAVSGLFKVNFDVVGALGAHEVPSWRCFGQREAQKCDTGMSGRLLVLL